ncbi:hypothetical protein Cgig2_031465 [Carnegiea gigantea]|uniref:Protein kinase domain-containing protein n=1 Tax=Carnegiea gigantea TaxID=171969 RepID=A0A9Q1K7P0_9CARY|nr:hypothetical protein Cgig2_031465 [Carnegiea gigantea]
MAIHKDNSNSTWIRGNFIGKGSYGTVSLGIRDSDGSVFAVKSAAKNSLSSIEALENEIRILRSISSSSPYIVEFYGDEETPTHRNLFLEYVAGGDVASSGGVSDVEHIRSYAWCLVVALKSVHSEGVVHCDVKGSNVLLCSESGIAKLADFGSAKRSVDDFDQRSKMVPRGSPLWMAPEVVRGESQGFEADVWSLGCTVLEMFTGKPAWQDRGAHTLYQIGYSDDLPEFPARLPELARDFLEKCLNRDPNLRWSCDQLLQHPFLVPAPSTKIAESSPRSILDWQTLDFSHDDDDDDDHEFEDFDEVPVRATISKLATTAGVNWESDDDDGWVEVRGRSKEVEVGTISEFCDLDEGKVGISRSMVGINWEDVSDGDCDRDTWMYLNGDDEVGGGDWGHGGSCDCEQSGEVELFEDFRKKRNVES